MLTHNIQNHSDKDFKIRRRILNDVSGELLMRSVHFPINISDIKKRLGEGKKCIIDVDHSTIRFKRPKTDCETAFNSKEEEIINVTPIENNINHPIENSGDEDTEKFKKTLEVIKESGRGDDFISVLDGIISGTLDPKNIAFHLMLDIGNFLSSETIKNVRYNTVTMDFWSVVYKMFRGKATRFFRGSMATDIDDKEGKC